MRVPVLISGAGPTGLTLAHELARAGIQSYLIDQKLEPVKTSNALAVHAKTLEIWEDMGLSEQALDLGHRIRKMNLHTHHRLLGQIDLGDLNTNYPFVLGLPQRDTETLLVEKLKALGGQVQWGVEAIGCEKFSDHVEVQVKNKGTNQTQTISADWLVVCEGSHSLLRQTLNIPFRGSDYEERFIMADLPIDWGFSNNEGNIFFTSKGVMAVLPLKEYARVILDVTSQPHLSVPQIPSFEQFKTLVEKRCPYPIHLEQARWLSGFGVHRKCIPKYQYGRVLLAGDSAHEHSPVGGQGMNLGIQDAYNLAWKLALTINHRVSSKVLGSYTQERLPQAKSILRATSIFTKLLTLQNLTLQWGRDKIIRWTLSSSKNRLKIANQISGLAQHYTQGMLYFKKAHPCVGSRLKKDEFFSNDILDPNPTKFNLIVMLDGVLKNPSIEKSLEEIKNICAQQADMITCHRCSTVETPGIILIRPDRYIAAYAPIRSAGKFKKWLKKYLCVSSC